MTLRRSGRLALAAAGLAAYAGLAVPEFIRAATLCAPGAAGPYLGYRCAGALPHWSHFLPVLLPAPFFLLFLSSRLRRAASFGHPFARPRSAPWVANLLLALLAAWLAFAARPDWSLPRAPVDLATCIAYALLTVFLALLLAVRTDRDADDRSQGRAFGRAGRALLAGGLLLYVAVVPIELWRMDLLSRHCPPDTACDWPGMGFVAMMAVWAVCWIPFLGFLAVAGGWRGIRPWPDAEPRIAAILAGLLLVALGIMSAIGLWSLLLGLFYAVFGLWFLAVQHVCGRAARSPGAVR